MTTARMPQTAFVDPFAKLEPDRSQNSWRAAALARARRLWLLMTTAKEQPDAPPSKESAEVVNQYLTGVVNNVARDGDRHRIRALFTGERVDAVTINLHAAEAVVARYYDASELESRIPRLLAQVEKTLLPHDARRLAADKCFGPVIQRGLLPGELPAVRRMYVQTLQTVNDIADQQLDRLRKFRNQILMWTVGLLVIAVAIGITGALAPEAINLCFEPSGNPPVCPTSGGTATGGNIAVVLLVGLAGASLSVALALRNSPQTSAPYNVSAALLLLKLPCGALTALVGLLLIRGQFVPGFSAIDSREQVLAYAAVFGYAQHLLTRLVDNKGREVLDRVSNTEPPGLDERKDRIPAWAVRGGGDGQAPLPQQANGQPPMQSTPQPSEDVAKT